MTLALPAPAKQIELRRSEYRRLGKWGCARFILECIRHPIYAFMAYQAANPDPPETQARDQAVMFAAIVHGFVLWALLSR